MTEKQGECIIFSLISSMSISIVLSFLCIPVIAALNIEPFAGSHRSVLQGFHQVKGATAISHVVYEKE
jgi:hypothetical protein